MPRIGSIALHLALLVTTLCFVLADDDAPPKLPAGQSLPDRTLYRQGQYVFRQNCVICHGERGDGNGEMASQLTPKPRQFTSGTFKYRSTPYGKLPTTDDLLRTVREGRAGTAMGIFGHLPEADIRAVVEYIKFFSRKWRKPENYAEPLLIPELPRWFDDPSQKEAHVKSGATTFASQCASCHGTAGAGDGPNGAGLMDEWGNPIKPANLRSTALRSGSELRDLFRTISTGLNGTPMVGFANLPEDQRWELIAFITSLRADTDR